MIDITTENFESDVIVASQTTPVLVDFWAPWCGPCRMMAPQFEEAAGKLKGRAVLAKLNSDDSPQSAQRFGIRSIPTLIKLDHGKEVGRQTGAVGLAQILSFVG